MSESTKEDAMLDRLGALAGARKLPRGRDAEHVLREAMVVGLARARARTRTRILGALAGGAAVAVALLFATSLGTPAGPASPSFEVLALGPHRLTTTSGSALSVDALGPVTRLRLDAGSALFEVAPLNEGASFEVETPDARVRVVGTVFAIAIEEGRTRVDVFEGRVAVDRGHGAVVLAAGEHQGDGAAPDPRLTERGMAAGDARRTEEGTALREDRVRMPSVEEAVDVPEVSAPDGDDDPPTEGEGDSDVEAPRRRASIDLATLRALCDRGEFSAALAALEGARVPAAERGEWALLEGDAARATGDLTRAAPAYERAAGALTPSRAALAGFLAASTRERLGQPEAALAVLDAAHAADRGSPLEERALAMRVTLLARLGRTSDAQQAARRYLASFPGGEATTRMETIAE